MEDSCARKEISRTNKGNLDESSAGTLEASQSTASQAAQPPQFLATDVQNLPCFNPREDPNNLLVRWKRSFELNLLAKGVSSDRQKVELLFMLHTAGAELQDFKKLYYTLTGIEKLNRGPTCTL